MLILSILGWFLISAILFFGFFAFTGAPYVPTFYKEAKLAFKKLYKLGSKDLLVDLGSGDGVVLLAAAERGAKVHGIELNPILALISRWRLRKYKHAKVEIENIFTCHFPEETTVVYLFGENRDIRKFARKIKSESERLGKSLKIITYGVEIPGLKAEKTLRAFFLYTIDANSRLK